MTERHLSALIRRTEITIRFANVFKPTVLKMPGLHDQLLSHLRKPLFQCNV